MNEPIFSHRGIRVYALRQVELFEAARNGVLITGFKGFGMVGYITTTHIVEKLSLTRLGYIVTRYMPEFASYGYNGILAPFEIYGSPEKHIIVIVNHDIPGDRDRDAYAEALILLAKKLGMSKGIFIGGFDARFRQGEEKYRWLPSGGYPEKLDAPIMDKDLYVVGPLALLIIYSEIHRFPAATILPYAEAARPDPAAAAVAVDIISKMLGVNIPVEELIEMARRIEEAIEKVEQQKEAAVAPPTSTSERLYT